ncbi:hypothetical protein [Actinokineospora enzanensis]|uniref:hypothetical protein n=1 Tax=Actinokineospora enzanensis TaxID=155975 RepID=UPI00037B2E0E|nr:hypothetical protein [Actinokineospora enzanensis]
MDTLVAPLPIGHPGLRRALGAEHTAALLGTAPGYYATDPADLLRSALVVAVARWSARHGRALSVDAPAGLAHTVRRLAAPPAADTVGFAFDTRVRGETDHHVIEVFAEIAEGTIASTWTWRATAVTEHAVAELADTWCAALTGLATEAGRVTPLPDAASEPARITVDLPAAVDRERVREAVEAVVRDRPALASACRMVGSRAFAVAGVGAGFEPTPHQPGFGVDWAPMVRFSLVRLSSAAHRLTIEAHPAAAGNWELSGLGELVRQALREGDPDHATRADADSPPVVI